MPPTSDPKATPNARWQHSQAHPLKLFLAICTAALLATNTLAQSNSATAFADAQRLFKQGQPENALTRINAHIANEPRDAQARFLKGLILTEQNQPDEAIMVFTRMTEDFPELPEPHNNLAVLYAQQKQYDKARGALEMAIRTHPAYAIAHENLGDVYAKLASQAYDKALQIDSANSLAQNKLSLIRELISVSAKQTPPVRSSIVSGTRLTAADVRLTEGRPSPPQKPKTVTTAATVQKAAAPERTIPAVPATASNGKAAQRPSVNATATKQPAPPSKVEVTVNAPPAQDTVNVAALTLTLEAWASAWSRKDVPAYLNHYAGDFSPGGNLSRDAWALSRKQRVGKPGDIEVVISNVNVTRETDDQAVVRFLQQYRSNNLSSTTNKTLRMRRDGQRWLILEERVG